MLIVQVSQDARDFARFSLEKTILRHFAHVPDDAVERLQRKKSLQKVIDSLLTVLNGDWRLGRVAHRCQQLPSGRFCCSSRLEAA